MHTPQPLLFDIAPTDMVKRVVCSRHHKRGKSEGSTWQLTVFEDNLINILVVMAGDFYELRPDEIIGYHKKSREDVAHARQLICYLWGIHQLCHYRALVYLFGFKSHSNISKCRKKVWKRMRKDTVYQWAVKKMEQKLTEILPA